MHSLGYVEVTNSAQFDKTSSHNVDQIVFVLTPPKERRRDHCGSWSAGHGVVASTVVSDTLDTKGDMCIPLLELLVSKMDMF